jgi:hypothetical protein
MSICIVTPCPPNGDSEAVPPFLGYGMMFQMDLRCSNIAGVLLVPNPWTIEQSFLSMVSALRGFFPVCPMFYACTAVQTAVQTYYTKNSHPGQKPSDHECYDETQFGCRGLQARRCPSGPIVQSIYILSLIASTNCLWAHNTFAEAPLPDWPEIVRVYPMSGANTTSSLTQLNGYSSIIFSWRPGYGRHHLARLQITTCPVRGDDLLIYHTMVPIHCTS